MVVRVDVQGTQSGLEDKARLMLIAVSGACAAAIALDASGWLY